MHGRIPKKELHKLHSILQQSKNTSIILDCLTSQFFSQPTIDPLSLLHARLYLTIDQAEDVVEDEVASLAVRLKLERLGVVHGFLFLINLIPEN